MVSFASLATRFSFQAWVLKFVLLQVFADLEFQDWILNFGWILVVDDLGSSGHWLGLAPYIILVGSIPDFGMMKHNFI